MTWQTRQLSGMQAGFPPPSPDQRPVRMTPHSFLSKSETKSAGCDGPNGTRFPPGPVPVLPEPPKTEAADFLPFTSECREGVEDASRDRINRSAQRACRRGRNG